MHPRPLTSREREVLDALLAVDFPGVERLRREAESVQVRGGCDCGCPSIDFFVGPSNGMTHWVNAAVIGSETFDGLFLFTVDVDGKGEVLGGIEWVGQGESNPLELPPADDLRITLATT